MGRFAVGVDIGGTKIAVSLGRGEEAPAGELLLDRVSFPTEVSRGPEPAIEKILRAVSQILEKNHVQIGEVRGIGVSCGSPLDPVRGVIQSPPNLPGWDNVPIVDRLEARFGVRACLQNDANACAVAEWKFGAARGVKNAIFLTFGTGMGAGLILDGRLYSGANGMAGEVGHLRLENFGPVGYAKAGSFEGFCSGGGLAQLGENLARERVQRGEQTLLAPGGKVVPLTARQIAEAARQGDEAAAEVFQISGGQLGRALAILVDILNPERIVIGSIYQRCEDLLREPMLRALQGEALPACRKAVAVVPAELGDSIGDYAAISLAYLEE